MKDVIQYNSKGKYVKIVLKDGNALSNVKIYPDPYDPYSKRHIIERSNGDTDFIRTSEIDGIIYL